MEQARILVVHSALIAGAASFLLYLLDFCASLLARRSAVRAGARVADAAADITVSSDKSLVTGVDPAAFVEALGKLAEGLSKVGPGLTSLIAAVLFCAIAAVGAGALQDAPLADAPVSAETGTPAAPIDPAKLPPVKPKLPPPPRR